jgi:hypothetical protein
VLLDLDQGTGFPLVNPDGERVSTVLLVGDENVALVHTPFRWAQVMPLGTNQPVSTSRFAKSRVLLLRVQGELCKPSINEEGGSVSIPAVQK